MRTAVLSNDGHDLAAALQTIIEIGNEQALYAAIEDAFPGSGLIITQDNKTRLKCSCICQEYYALWKHVSFLTELCAIYV